MSFGFSVGELLALIKLATEIRRDFVGAPDQFKQINADIRTLAFALQDVEIYAIEQDINGVQEISLKNICEICQCVLEDTQKELHKYFSLASSDGTRRERAKRLWRRIQWEPDEIRDLRSRITSSIAALNSFTAANTRDNVHKMVERQDQQQHQEILDWLCPMDHASQQSEILGRRQEGTGQWVLDLAEYAQWRAARGETLFCHGIPGAGKTVLSSIVVDHLQETYSADRGAAICHLYCNFQHQNDQSFQNTLFSFLKQLSQASVIFPKSLKELFDQCRAKHSRPGREETIRVLYSVAASFSRVFIVVDALDECRTSDGCQRDLISLLKELQCICGANIMTTSRPIPHIVERFRDVTSIEILASDQDIARYIAGNQQHLPGFVPRSPGLLEEITNGVVSAASGMFLLAKLHLDSLRWKRSPKELRKTLFALAQGNDAYDEAYCNTMLRIYAQPRERRELAEQTLMWVVYARRPLTRTELQHALGVEIGEREFFEDNIPDFEDAISACCGLVTVDRDSDKVRLIHYTTQEFFERRGTQYFPDAQVEITNTCVTYLSFNVFQSRSHRVGRFPLYEYAGHYWYHHAHSQGFSELIRRFLCLPQQVQRSSDLLIDKSRLESYGGPRFNFTGLHMAAHCGLSVVLVKSILEVIDFDVQDSFGRTPLSYAVEMGHEAVVRLLLDNNAQVDIMDHYGTTALLLAVSEGFNTIARLLLDNNANVDIADGNGQTSLIAAAWDGHETIARLLLDNNAQVDIADGNGVTPLLFAAWKGHETIVRLLLDKNAQVNITNCCGDTPLIRAAWYGHETIVRLLLDNNAQVNMTNCDGYTPLMLAAGNGDEIIVRLLLDNDAQVDIADRDGQTPLILAGWGGCETTVRLLLDNNAQVNIADQNGYTPLIRAAQHGHETIVRLLLDKNAQVDTANHHGSTALSLAASGGYGTIVRLLLDGNAQFDTTDSSGSTPLSRAIDKGHEAVVCLLRERKPQVDTTDTADRTPLLRDTENTNPISVRLPLKNSAQAETAEPDECQVPQL